MSAPFVGSQQVDVEFRSVTKRFGDIAAVDEVSLVAHRDSSITVVLFAL